MRLILLSSSVSSPGSGIKARELPGFCFSNCFLMLAQKAAAWGSASKRYPAEYTTEMVAPARAECRAGLAVVILGTAVPRRIRDTAIEIANLRIRVVDTIADS